jgi:hypothetical protein
LYGEDQSEGTLSIFVFCIQGLFVLKFGYALAVVYVEICLSQLIIVFW